MMAAADYAEGKGTPPEELRLAFRCQQWGTLPCSGGLLDQPAGLVDRMTLVLNTHNAWGAWLKRDPGKDGEFVKAYPDTWRIVQHIIELRTHG